MKVRSHLSCLFATLLVAACGGGDDTASKTPDTTVVPATTVTSTLAFPVNTALSTFQQAAQSINLSAVDGAGVPYTLEIKQTPGETLSIEGLLTSTTTLVATLKKNGVLAAPVSQHVLYFQPSPYFEVGKLDVSGRYYVSAAVDTKVTVGTRPAALYLPTVAKVGDAGALNNVTSYVEANDVAGTKYGTETNAWVLNPDTASTAWLCVKTVTTPVSDPAFNETDCFKIDSTGAVLAVQVTISDGVQTLTFK